MALVRGKDNNDLFFFFSFFFGGGGGWGRKSLIIKIKIKIKSAYFRIPFLYDLSTSGINGLLMGPLIRGLIHFLQGLILASTDTTATTLTWALGLLLNNREAIKKAQQELDEQIGRERQVKESDTKKLVYLQAILKETLRLYPGFPLPHESAQDCIVGGYYIPAGTRLLVNAAKLHRDPKVWSDPCEFRPERFLTTHQNFDVRGQNFEFIPFGSGRRMCPGISFALQIMQLTLATLLHGFEIKTLSDQPIDMKVADGFTNLKALPLDVLLTPRLPIQVYQN